jgi:pimeloyl-ACP methyl ester carboxylesterase
MARLPAVLLTVAAFMATATSAAAEIPWQSCPGIAGFQCGRVDVPLDRSGATPGSVSIATARVPASSNPGRSAVVALAGGPGQAVLPLSEDFATVLGPALTERDLLLFDQRGTGLSGALSCPALSSGGSIQQITRRCAGEIGPRRAFYRTPDTVEDIEALRVAGGYDRLVLFGVSYGTKVALAYAAAHPAQVEALVLDSVVLPEGPDTFRRSSMAATPRVLADLCARGACRRATPSVRTDLARLAAQLRKKTLRGTVVRSDGSRRQASLGQAGLFGILLAGDLNPTLRAELPGAMRAALRGDATPILRLSVRSAGLENGAQSASADSDALFLTTTCEEAPLPWTRTAGLEQRSQEAVRAAEAIPRAQLGPFSARVALGGGVIPLCLNWPNASPAPGEAGALPPVRTLVLDGQMDVRTPLEDARQVPARIPGAEVVAVPFTGHSVLGSDQSTCAQKAIATFFAGQPEGPCPTTENPYAPTPLPPSSLDVVKAIGPKGKAGRTIAAAVATVTDARRQVVGETLALGQIPGRVGGLRAGTVSATSSGLRLRGYQYVPGVSVSGRIATDRSGTVTVSGRSAVRGTLKLTAGGRRVSGTLGGRRVRATAASAASVGGDDGLPTLAQALARPRLG